MIRYLPQCGSSRLSHYECASFPRSTLRAFTRALVNPPSLLSEFPEPSLNGSGLTFVKKKVSYYRGSVTAVGGIV